MTTIRLTFFVVFGLSGYGGCVMKKKRASKAIAILITVQMVFAVIPIMASTAYAETSGFVSPTEGAKIELGDGVNIEYITGYDSSNRETYCDIRVNDPDGNLIQNESFAYDGLYASVKSSFVPAKLGKYTVTAECGVWITEYNYNTLPPSSFTYKSQQTTNTVTIEVVKKKAANPLTVKGRTAKVKYSKLKKKNQTLKVSKVITFKNKGKGTRSYKLVSAKKGKKNFKKKFTVNKTTGNVTVKKGLKKGTYKVKIKVTAAGNDNYKEAIKPVTVTIKVE